MKKHLFKGVTLIELLIVIGIISTLSVVMVTLINPAESGRKSRDAKRISDLATIKRAIDMALADKQELTDTSGTISISSVNNIGSLDVSKYLPATPPDPSYGTSGSIQVVSYDCSTKITQAKSGMVYEYISDGDTYAIRSRIESMSNCNSLTSDGLASDYYEMGTNLSLFSAPTP